MTCNHTNVSDESGKTTVVCNDRTAGTTLILNPMEHTLQRALSIATGMRGAPVRTLVESTNEEVMIELAAQGWKPTSLMVMEYAP